MNEEIFSKQIKEKALRKKEKALRHEYKLNNDSKNCGLCASNPI